MTQEIRLRRVQCNYQLENARFLLECDFSKQYHRYYLKRLEKTRPYLEFNCRSKWNPKLPIYSLAEVAAFSLAGSDDSDLCSTSSLSLELDGNYKHLKRIRRSPSKPPITSTQKQEECETECIIIGTIFKRMKLHPDVIEELNKGDFHVKCERYLGHYTSPDDTLVLEDTNESICLVGNIDPKVFVTGVVVALLGISINDGSQFFVRDVCYAEPNRQILYDDIESHFVDPERPLSKASDGQPIFLMVVSELGFHHEMAKRSNLTRALQNMIDFIWGGAKYVNDERSSRVARILVVGNCLSEDRLKHGEKAKLEPNQDELTIWMKQSRQVKPYLESIHAVNHMDDFFAQLSKTIDVDVMPGPSDPSPHILPQQPFHPCMFPKSSMFSTFNCTTNPYHAIYNDNVEVFATSGQNVDIISKFSAIEDPIKIMKHHLLWGNCAPSAPDNLYSAPYEDEDPYVIDFIPDIYIVGCQKIYQTDYYYYKSSESRSMNLSQSSGLDSSRLDSNIIDITLESPDNDSTTSRAARELNSSTLRIASHPLNSQAQVSNFLPDIAGEFGHIDTVEATQGNNMRNDLIPTRKSRTLLVTIPKFCETYSCVLINLKDLESHLIPFE